MRQKTFLSLVVYTRNEQDSVGAFLAMAAAWLAEHFELYEIVLVDDASSDATLERARAAAAGDRLNVVLLELSRRHGIEAGIKAGLDRALGDWVVELETTAVDFELDLLLEMYEQGARGFDVVSASGDQGGLRSRLFYRVVNRYADLDVPLRTERVRLVSRRTLNAMLSMNEKVRYRKALYAVVGSRQHHVTYRPSAAAARRPLDRETSTLAFDILLSFSGFGLRLAHTLSFLFGGFSLLAAVYAVFVYLLKSDVVPGWTTVTVVTSGGFAGVFLVLGVLGEYLARILVEVRGRPLYSVRATEVHVPAGHRRDSERAVPRFIATQQEAARHEAEDQREAAEQREAEDQREAAAQPEADQHGGGAPVA